MVLIQERSKINSLTTLIEPPSVSIGEMSFAEGNRNKRSYVSGFEAGMKIVMEYWEGSVDIGIAKSNIEHIKELMGSPEDKNRFIKGSK